MPAVLERLEARYRGALGWAIRNRFTVLAAATAAILVGVALYPKIGSEMMPLADVSQAYVQLEAQPGTSFAADRRRSPSQVEQLLLKQPEVVEGLLRGRLRAGRDLLHRLQHGRGERRQS